MSLMLAIPYPKRPGTGFEEMVQRLAGPSPSEAGSRETKCSCVRPVQRRMFCRASNQSTALALLDLAEFQFDRRAAAKNRHRDLEPGARLIDLLNNAIEGREWTIRHTDLLTYLEGNRGLGPLEIVHGQELRNLWRFMSARADID